MSRVTPQMRAMASLLISAEAKWEASSEGKQPAVVRVCEKLRPHLATLMGKAGFRAVLSRALAVLTADLAWLGAVEVNGEGILEGWDKMEAQVGPKELAEGGVLLVAQLLGLLSAFIGENLTLRLLRDVWPTLSPENI